MPDELDELRRRLDTVESRLDSESGLRAMMDHDLAKLAVRLDAQDRLLRALSATQSDHTQRLTRIEDRVGGLEVRFTGLEEQFGAIVERFGHVEGTVSRVEVGVQAILGLLSNGR